MEENAVVPAEAQQRTRTLLRVAIMMTLMFVFFWGVGVEESMSDGGGGTPAPVPDDPALPVVRYLASKIAAAANGLVYPANFTTERFQGRWLMAGPAAGRFLRPALAPNVTAQFAVREGHGPANLSFAANEGILSMKLVSSAPFASVPALQDVAGEVLLFDGDVASPSQLHVPVKGVYAADQGLLYLVGSTLGGRISLVDGSVPSASPSPSSSPPAPSPSGPGATSSPAPPSPAPGTRRGSEGGRDARGRVLQASPAAPTPPTDPTGVDRCDLLFALRFRPIDFDGSWVPPPVAPFPPPSSRRMEAGQASAAYVETSWPMKLVSSLGPALPGGARVDGEGGGSTANPNPPSSSSSLLLPRFIKDAAAVEGGEGGEAGGVAKAGASSADLLLQAVEQLSAWAGGRGTPVPPPPSGSNGAGSGATTMTTTPHVDDASHGHPSSSTYLDAITGLEDGLLSSGMGRALRPRSLSTANPGDLYPGMRYLPMAGHVVSPNCNFSLNVSVVGVAFSLSTIEDKLGGFVFASTMGGVALMLVTTYQIVQSSSLSAATRVSLATVGMQWVLDGVFFFLFTAGGVLLTSLITAFAVPAFLHFALFVLLQIRFLLLIKKARNPDIFTGADRMQRELCKMYCLLYPVLLAAFTVLYSGSGTTVKALLVLAYSYWVPQILHSASRDSRSGLTRAYILTNTVVRLLPLAYLLCCPYNVAYMLWSPEPSATALAWAASDAPPPMKQAWMLVTGVTPAFLNPARAAVFWSWARFGFFLIAWQAVQVAVISLQAKPGWGPRFFVPYAFLPPKYNYHRRVVVANGRVFPDAAATGPWVRHPSHDDGAGAEGGGGAVPGDGTGPQPGGAAGGAPPTATPSFLSGVVRSFARDAVSTAHATVETARWFTSGCSILARDGWKRTSTTLTRRVRHARARGFTLSALGFGRDDVINRSASGPVAVGGGDDGTGSNSAWLDFMSPRQRLGAAGGAGGRYARLDGSTEDAGGHLGGDSAPPDGGLPKIPVAGAGMHSVELREGSGAAHGGGGALSAAEEGRAGGGGTGGSGGVGVSGVPEAGTRVTVDDSEPVGEPSWASVDCVICMEGVSFPCRHTSYMVTPCDHLFHTQCLRPWMEHKVECPTCRMQLPEP